MSSFKRTALLLLGVLVIYAQISPVAVLGATSPSSTNGGGQALEIGPPLLELNGNPGQTITASISLRDISSGSLIVSNEINDFVAKGDSGIPEILFNGSAKDPYSLKSYIVPLPNFLLKPQQQKQLQVQINIPTNASPGGHYGVIRFTGTPASLNGKSGVSLSASIGTLVLLTVSGKIVEHLSTSSFYVSQNINSNASSFFQNAPLTFSEIVKNDGNEHVIPQGYVTVKDMFGHKVISLIVNIQQGNVLPGSKRKFSEDMFSKNSPHKRLFGRYTATFSMTYGTPKHTLTDSLSFWVIPVDLIVVWLVVLIGGFFLIRYMLKRYNEHIIGKAQQSKKKK